MLMAIRYAFKKLTRWADVRAKPHFSLEARPGTFEISIRVDAEGSANHILFNLVPKFRWPAVRPAGTTTFIFWPSGISTAIVSPPLAVGGTVTVSGPLGTAATGATGSPATTTASAMGKDMGGDSAVLP